MAYRIKRVAVIYREVELCVVISEDQECLGPGVATVTDKIDKNGRPVN